MYIYVSDISASVLEKVRAHIRGQVAKEVEPKKQKADKVVALLFEMWG